MKLELCRNRNKSGIGKWQVAVFWKSVQLIHTNSHTKLLFSHKFHGNCIIIPCFSTFWWLKESCFNFICKSVHVCWNFSIEKCPKKFNFLIFFLVFHLISQSFNVVQENPLMAALEYSGHSNFTFAYEKSLPLRERERANPSIKAKLDFKVGSLFSVL